MGLVTGNGTVTGIGTLTGIVIGKRKLTRIAIAGKNQCQKKDQCRKKMVLEIGSDRNRNRVSPDCLSDCTLTRVGRLSTDCLVTLTVN